MFSRLIVASVLFFGCSNESVQTGGLQQPGAYRSGPLLAKTPLSSRIANYTLEATLDPTQHQILGTMELSWKNTSENATAELPFHLYLNAFQKNSLFMKELSATFRGETPEKSTNGKITIDNIKVGEIPIATESLRFHEEDQTLVYLPLTQPVLPGDVIQISMTFEATLPYALARTGYRDDFHMVAQWFPKIGVLDNSGWHAEPFHANAEFFADFGTYDVEITVPSAYAVDATGVLVAVQETAPNKTLTYHAEDVHDFAWFADRKVVALFGVAKNALGDIDVIVYSRPGQRDYAKRHLAAAVSALEFFSKTFRDYPYSRMVVIDPPIGSEGAIGGMEYPTLVTTAGDTMSEGIRIAEVVTIHEVAHNWFQGMLATDEVEHAWLDEGLTNFVTGLALADMFGPESDQIDWGGWHAGYFEMENLQASGGLPPPNPTATPSYGFVDNSAYGSATYGKTTRALYTLGNLQGSEKVEEALHDYASTFSFAHPSPDDFWSVMESHFGNIRWFSQAIQTRGFTDYRVRNMECGEQHRCEVSVQNLGAIAVPIDIEIGFEDETVSRFPWSGDAPFKKKATFAADVTWVKIDPDGKNLLDRGIEGKSKGKVPGVASSTVSIPALFWTQTVFQTLGAL